MRYVIITVLSFLAGTFLFQYVNHAHAKETPQKDEKLICDVTDKMQKILEEKGYFLLLNMKNPDNVVESLWVGGQSATIMAKVPEGNQSCLLAVMNGVIYNADTVEAIYKNMVKETGRKDL